MLDRPTRATGSPSPPCSPSAAVRLRLVGFGGLEERSGGFWHHAAMGDVAAFIGTGLAVVIAQMYE